MEKTHENHRLTLNLLPMKHSFESFPRKLKKIERFEEGETGRGGRRNRVWKSKIKMEKGEQTERKIIIIITFFRTKKKEKNI